MAMDRQGSPSPRNSVWPESSFLARTNEPKAKDEARTKIRDVSCGRSIEDEPNEREGEGEEQREDPRRFSAGGKRIRTKGGRKREGEREREREEATGKKRRAARQIARRQRDFLKGGCNASAILFRETAPVSSALRGGFGLDWGCAWGQRPQLGWLPPYLPPCTPTTPPSSSGPFLFLQPLSSTFYTLPYALYARPRCGRRRLGQVRLSLGFNIGENTGFYLIARYPVLCPFRAVCRTEKTILGTKRASERASEQSRWLQMKRDVYRARE